MLFMNSEVLPSCRFSPFVRVFMVLSLRGFVFKMSVVFSDEIYAALGKWLEPLVFALMLMKMLELEGAMDWM